LDALGIKNIVICMDGDAAGRGAEGKIYAATENKFDRKRFRLPFENPSVDPGNMSEERVETLREFGKF
jgi:DNA primase